MTLTSTPLRRRSIPGYRGGRPLGWTFWFAPRDGDLYPSESQVIQSTRFDAEPGDGVNANWMWALAHARTNRQWLVVGLTGTDPKTVSKEAADVRSSLIRTGVRIGLRLTTQKVGTRLYVWADDRE